MWNTLISSLRPYDLDRLKDVLADLLSERYKELKEHLNATEQFQDWDMTQEQVTVLSLLYRACDDIDQVRINLMGEPHQTT